MEKTILAEHTHATILEMASLFQRSRILLTAFELDIFSVLDNKQLTSSEVAQIINADQRATNRLMNALCALGFLEKTDEVFANCQASKQLKKKSSPAYLAGLQHSINLWESWSTLTDVVRAGKSLQKDSLQTRSTQEMEGFIHAMHDRAHKTAPLAVNSLDLNGVKRILDVGGGSAAYSMAFVQAREGIEAVVLELPNVVPITHKFIAHHGFTGKITTQAGDYHSTDFGVGYDLIFLSAIVHINSFDENMLLIKRCAEALNSNGQIVIQDQIMDAARVFPVRGAIFALNMLVGTSRGDTYTENEMRNWLLNAGISDIKLVETPVPTTLIVGRKN